MSTYKRTALGWSAAVSAGLTTLNLADWMRETPPIVDDDDMFDGDEPEREEIDHQALRWDHASDLRKHG